MEKLNSSRQDFSLSFIRFVIMIHTRQPRSEHSFSIINIHTAIVILFLIYKQLIYMIKSGGIGSNTDMHTNTHTIRYIDISIYTYVYKYTHTLRTYTLAMITNIRQ